MNPFKSYCVWETTFCAKARPLPEPGKVIMPNFVEVTVTVNGALGTPLLVTVTL